MIIQKKLLILLVLTTICLISTVNAELTQIVTDVSVEWDGPNEFMVITEGDDRSFRCGENDSEDKEWEVVIYQDLGEDIDECQAQNSNLTTRLDEMSVVCQDFLEHLDSTLNYAEEMQDLNRAQGNCQARYEEKRNQSTDLQGKLDSCENKLDSKETALESCQSTNSRLEEDKKDLETETEDIKGTRIIAFLIGGVVGFGACKMFGSKGDEEGKPWDEDED